MLVSPEASEATLSVRDVISAVPVLVTADYRTLPVRQQRLGVNRRRVVRLSVNVHLPLAGW